jgi:phosphoglucomutase
MGYKDAYTEWTKKAIDTEVAAELLAMANDDAEIQSRFSDTLHFGTAGLRSKLGAGANRMNIYTVRRATQGLATYVNAHGGKAMAVAYDTRTNSDVFAEATALCLAANGIKTYLFEKATSVPELSFAIRHLGTYGGVAITASHNPKDYNGYKVYAPWGGQLLSDASAEVTQHIEQTDGFDMVKTMDKDEALQKGLLVMIGSDIDAAYYEQLKQMAASSDVVKTYGREVKVAYTPLFGTGMRTFEGVMSGLPYRYAVVDSQRDPDPAFPGMDAPNPEDPKAMKDVITLARQTGADIAFGTDPDADRLGAAIPNDDGEYIMLSGNQVGCILIDALLKKRREAGTMDPSDYIIKSFVSSQMADDIAAYYGVRCLTVPTGFKYISDIMFNQEPDSAFVFGFEESCGFLASRFVGDKDGVMAGLLLLEVLCDCKKNGQTLYQRLRSLYDKYGWHKEKVISVVMDGADGMTRVAGIMATLRGVAPLMLGGQRVEAVMDYLSGTCQNDGQIETIDFPRVDALKFTLERGWMSVRPSGTEPKLKVYIGVSESDNAASEERLKALETDAREKLGI